MAAFAAQMLSFALFPYLFYQLDLERMADVSAETPLHQVLDSADGPVLADEEMGMLPLIDQPTSSSR
jgi:hypothetical protein